MFHKNHFYIQSCQSSILRQTRASLNIDLQLLPNPNPEDTRKTLLSAPKNNQLVQTIKTNPVQPVQTTKPVRLKPVHPIKIQTKQIRPVSQAVSSAKKTNFLAVISRFGFINICSKPKTYDFSTLRDF